MFLSGFKLPGTRKFASQYHTPCRYMLMWSLFMNLSICAELFLIAPLPTTGEAQKIDRFMEAFASAYFEANPGVFTDADTAYTLAFSVIMLNTDHFNPSIREDRKMTRAQFISNNRAIDEALTPQFLGTMYFFPQSRRKCINVVLSGLTVIFVCASNCK